MTRGDTHRSRPSRAGDAASRLEALGRLRERSYWEGVAERAWAAAPVLLWVTLAAVLAVSFRVTPQQIDAGHVQLSAPCSILQLLGHACPMCGMTRAFSALSHGQFGAALTYNWGSPLAYALTWYGLIVLSRRTLSRLIPRSHASRPRTLPHKGEQCPK